jgi:hypothetical protein
MPRQQGHALAPSRSPAEALSESLPGILRSERNHHRPQPKPPQTNQRFCNQIEVKLNDLRKLVNGRNLDFTNGLRQIQTREFANQFLRGRIERMNLLDEYEAGFVF